MNACTYFLWTLSRLEVSVVKNRLARELLLIHPVNKLLVKQLSHPRPPLLNNIYSGLVRWPQKIDARVVCKLIIDNSLKIVNCKLKIESKGAFDA